MGQVEFESANYEKADRWFARVDLDREEDLDTWAAAATAFAIGQKPARAERLFARRDAARSNSARMHDLQVRLAVDPQDEQAAGELRRIVDAPTAVSAAAGSTAGPQLPEDWREDLSLSGPELYARHCGACHGAGGDGRGRAAWLLFPRPRDFRAERFRLVSARNGVPTLEDLVAVSKQGMPGTSMPPFENLSDDQHELVAQEVVRLHREGVRDHFIDVMEKEGEEIDEEDVRQVVTNCTVPVDVVDDPEIGPPSSQSIARGKTTYLQLGCEKCHGHDGAGAWDVSLVNEKGYPTRSRDLVHEPLKGGEEPEGMYRRIFLGMPGTPHPASWNLPADQLIDLVHYCRSLSREPKRELTNHQRAILASGPAYLSTFGGLPLTDGTD
jgi:mono/diheme cytochrome c family protein